MVLGFGCEKEGCSEDGGGVVGHEGVCCVEALHVLDCCCLCAKDTISLWHACKRKEECHVH